MQKQRGFILLAVVLTLTVLAVVAFMLGRQGAIEAGGVLREHQPDAARYVAEAGYNHAVWQLNRQNCSGYSDIPATSLGSDSYTAAVTDSSGAALTAGSPATISATGTLADGVSHTMVRQGVKIYHFPLQQLVLQPDSVAGKDNWATADTWTNNYGTTPDMMISGGASPKHFMIQFDLSSIPAGSVIVSARLEMLLNYMASENPDGEFSIHAMLEGWTEGTGDWWDAGDGANWVTSDGSTSWTWDSNHQSNAVAATPVNSGFTGWHGWDIAPLVQQWVSGERPNFGLLVKGNDSVADAEFYSSDSSNASTRPRLTITYACECGKTCGASTLPAKKIYWTDDDAQLIQRADEDGSNIETVISGQYKVRGLDLDTVNGKIYWTSDTVIKRADLDGSNMETLYTTSKLNFDVKLDVAGGRMYWTYDNLDQEVMRANLDGSNVQTINSALSQPMYLSLDEAAGHVYLSDYSSDAIERLNLDGSGRTTVVGAAGPAMGSAIDVVNGKIYWSSGSSGDWIKRANLDGSNVETILTGLNSPQDIVYDNDNDRIYWTDSANAEIHRANADGSNLETIVSGLTRPRGIVIVDADLVPPTGGGGSPACNGTFLDQFNTVSFANNDGSLNWSGDWLEINESDGANKSDVRVRDDNGPYQLWLRDNDGGGEGVEREADLSGAAAATLSLLYRRSSLDDADDYVVLEISANGSAGPWTELARFAGSATDSAYQSFSQDISSSISATTRIRLLTSPTMGNFDTVIFDDIQIQCSP